VRLLIEPAHHAISITRQCDLLGLGRSSYYYDPRPEDPYRLSLKEELDRIYTLRPYYGVERMVDELSRRGLKAGHYLVRQLMREMGIQAIYPRPRRTSLPGTSHRIYPYLLANRSITRPDDVWAADLTYLPLRRQGFGFLAAILDWSTRYIVAWGLSNTMEAEFVYGVLDKALNSPRRPSIHNSDQGCQYTSHLYTKRLLAEGIQVSMDGKGRWFDNVMVERLWRTIKQEDVYIKGYNDLWEAEEGLAEYIEFYNCERRHKSLDRRTPEEAYRG